LSLIATLKYRNLFRNYGRKADVDGKWEYILAREGADMR
jgi:hypothetical protein